MISFNLWGINFQIRFLFVAMCTVFLLVDKTGTGILGLWACLIHEMGHVVAFAIIGVKPKQLVFEIAGIRLIKPKKVLSFKQELFTILSGSATNILVFLAFSYSMNSISNLSVFACIHLILGVMNLLPFEGLDGAELLKLTLTKFTTPKTSYIIEKTIQIIALMGLSVASVFVLMGTGFNASIIISLLYVVILAFFKK